MENTTARDSFPLSIHCNILAFDRTRRPGNGSILSSKFSNSLINTNPVDGGAKIIWIQAVSSALDIRQGGSSPLQLSFSLEHPPSKETILLLFYSCEKKDIKLLNESEIIKDSVLLGQIFVPINALNLNQKNRFSFFLENTLTSLHNTSYEEAAITFKKACERSSGHLKVNANFWVSDDEVAPNERGKLVSDMTNNFAYLGQQKSNTPNPNLYQSGLNSVNLSQLKKPGTSGSYLYTPSYAEYDVTPQDSASNLHGRTGMHDLDYDIENVDYIHNYDVSYDYVKVAKAHRNMSRMWRIDTIEKLYSKIQNHEEAIMLLSVINAWRSLSRERYVTSQLRQILLPLMPDNAHIEDLEGLSSIIKHTKSTISNLKAQYEKVDSVNESLTQKYQILKEKNRKNKEIINQQQQEHLSDIKGLVENFHNKSGSSPLDRAFRSTSTNSFGNLPEGTRTNTECEAFSSLNKETNLISPSSTIKNFYQKEKSFVKPLPEFRTNEINNTRVLFNSEDKNDDSTKKNPRKNSSNLVRSPSLLARLAMSVKRS